ncbi:MAG: radical SAM/SPASM domain-containing protein [Sciscionella sp.]
MDLIARREHFGYLFMDRESERLFASRYTGALPFADPSRIVLPASDGMPSTANSLALRDTKIVREDILCAPTYVEFYPTMRCNERCHFCYVGDVLNTGQSFPADRISEMVANVADSGVFQFVILGGEPLTYKHLPALLDAANGAGLVTSMSTNGTVDRDDVWERVRAYNVHLNISLQSHIPEIHDGIVGRDSGCAQTLALIDKLKAASTDIHVSVVAAAENGPTLPETIAALGQRGVQSTSIFHTQGTGYAVENATRTVAFRDYVDIVHRSRLAGQPFGTTVQATTNFPFLVDDNMSFELGIGLEHLIYGSPDGRRVAYILNDGSVLATLVQGMTPERAVGSILNDSFTDLWNNAPEFDRVRQLQPKAKCTSCPYFSYCRGGPTNNLATAATTGATPECPRFDVLLRLE